LRRMDGNTSVVQRSRLMDDFNANPDRFVFLLTTKVGGLGVNLTGADRVLIYDPGGCAEPQRRGRGWEGQPAVGAHALLYIWQRRPRQGRRPASAYASLAHATMRHHSSACTHRAIFIGLSLIPITPPSGRLEPQHRHPGAREGVAHRPDSAGDSVPPDQPRHH
jgi:hypothetical protein